MRVPGRASTRPRAWLCAPQAWHPWCRHGWKAPMCHWAGRTTHGPRPDTRLSRGLPSASRSTDRSVSGGPGWERQGMTPPRWWLGGWRQVPGPSEDLMSEQVATGQPLGVDGGNTCRVPGEGCQRQDPSPLRLQLSSHGEAAVSGWRARTATAEPSPVFPLDPRLLRSSTSSPRAPEPLKALCGGVLGVEPPLPPSC